MRCFLIALLCCLPCVVASAAEPLVTILQGTRSTRDRAELAYVRQVTERTSRWLTAEGVPHTVTNDEQVQARGLGDTAVVLLPYNPTVPNDTLQRLTRFVQGGGRLLVWYSADARLAALLHLRLGEYRPLPAPGHWSSIRFTREAPPFLPDVVRQASRNIRPVYPARADAFTIAWWHNASGARTQDPAWVLSSRGAWMTHILTERDADAKRRMLLGLVAHFAPDAWQYAALHQARLAGTVGHFDSLQATFEAITAQAAQQDRSDAVRPMLHEARGLAGAIHTHIARAEFIDAVERARELELRMRAAYGRAQAGRAGEFRGVWDHQGTGLYPGNWARSLRALQQAGMTAVLPNVQWGGLAHHASDVYPGSSARERHGDQLEQCARLAPRYGLAVHAWKICWNLTEAPAAFRDRMAREGRLQRDANGNAIPWLCPAIEANRTMELAAIEELARYPVAGVHLDYIRYPGSHACFCDASRRDFEAGTGRRVKDWPADARHGAHAEAYAAWRVHRISTFVSDAAARVRAVRPGVKLSAAVYGAYPDCKRSIAQDWPAWLRSGDLDFACPMIYFPSLPPFEKYLGIVTGLPGTSGMLYPGIGVTARESRLDAVDTIEQIRRVRAAGAAGFTLYQLDDTLMQEILPILRMGITAP